MALDVDPRQAAEFIEALIRFSMAEHAAIKPRGYDSQRARNEIHHEIDGLFDKLAEYRALA